MNVGEIIKVRKCRHCKEPAGTTGRCEKHNEAHKADQRRRIAERRAAGLCQCGGDRIAGLTICATCQGRNKRSQVRKRAVGNCLRCAMGNGAVAAGMCRVCWMKKIASDCLKTRGQAMRFAADMLEMLWQKQNGICALTGDALIPGDNASVDHIVPRSRGGSDDANNLRWVTFYSNVAKRDLTDSEFKALCLKVVALEAKKGGV